MDENFVNQRTCNVVEWFGEPMLYDMGLYVNRTLEEHNASIIYVPKR